MIKRLMLFLVVTSAPALAADRVWYTYWNSVRPPKASGQGKIDPAVQVPQDPSKFKWTVTTEKGKTKVGDGAPLFVRLPNRHMATSSKSIPVDSTITVEFLDSFGAINFFGIKLPGTESDPDAEIFWLPGTYLRVEPASG